MDKKKVVDFLTKEISEKQIYIDEPMKKHTSFKIGGVADIFIRIKTLEELEHVIDIVKKENIQLTIVGNGSNILVRDAGVRGIVAKLEFDQIEIENIDKDVIVTVGAGVKLGELAQKLLKEEISGFEFAAGIPGTIGGAVKMNAGAYGKEMKDIVLETKCFDIDKYKKVSIEVAQKSIVKNAPSITTLTNEEQDFSYRHSIFQEKQFIILETKLKLTKEAYKDIKAKMDEYMASRNEKQPVHMPSAGSTFKRGTDYITAKLIDECGLKGYKIGNAEVSNLHAGFIVNKGNATAKDVLDLIKYIQNTVFDKTGKKIELEIEILGVQEEN